MSNITRINYDELTQITKKLQDESEQVVQLRTNTRQKLEALRTEWVGTAADKFFTEMEGELLPAILRLDRALIISQNVLTGIMKTVHDADNETAGYFNRLDGAVISASGAGGGINIGPAGGASGQFVKWEVSGDAVNQFQKVEGSGGAASQFDKIKGAPDGSNQFQKIEGAAGAASQFDKIKGAPDGSSQFMKIDGSGSAASQFDKINGAPGASSQFQKIEGSGGAASHYVKFEGNSANQFQKGSAADQFQKGVDSLDAPNTPSGQG